MIKYSECRLAPKKGPNKEITNPNMTNDLDDNVIWVTSLNLKFIQVTSEIIIQSIF